MKFSNHRLEACNWFNLGRRSTEFQRDLRCRGRTRIVGELLETWGDQSRLNTKNPIVDVNRKTLKLVKPAAWQDVTKIAPPHCCWNHVWMLVDCQIAELKTSWVGLSRIPQSTRFFALWHVFSIFFPAFWVFCSKLEAKRTRKISMERLWLPRLRIFGTPGTSLSIGKMPWSRGETS